MFFIGKLNLYIYFFVIFFFINSSFSVILQEKNYRNITDNITIT